jgi:CRP/FNR family cyclic AMP-dependent transcriptional regulator
VAKPSSELLRAVPMFASLGEKDLERLGGEFFERSFEPGETIASEGAEGRSFFVIESGEATVSVQGQEVARLGPGDNFGEIALIDKQARSATVTAETAMHCYVLPIWSFRPIVEGSPEMAWTLLETLAGRLRAAEAR